MFLLYTSHTPSPAPVIIINLSYKNKQWRLPSKKKERGKNLSPRNRKACHNAPAIIVIRIITMSFDDCHQNLELNVDYKLKPDTGFLYCTVVRNFFDYKK
jgi:hypothetical protein